MTYKVSSFIDTFVYDETPRFSTLKSGHPFVMYDNVRLFFPDMAAIDRLADALTAYKAGQSALADIGSAVAPARAA